MGILLLLHALLHILAAGASVRGRKAPEARAHIGSAIELVSMVADEADVKPASVLGSAEIPAAQQFVRSTADLQNSVNLSSAATIIASGEAAASGMVLNPQAVLEMENSVLELLTNANGATPLQSSVEQIKNLVNETMMPKVMRAHTANQKEITELGGSFAGCASKRTHGMSQAEKKKNTYEASSPLHKACRAREAELITEVNACLTAQKSEEKVQELQCQRVKDLEGDWGNEARNKQIASKMSGETAKMYIKRMSSTYCGNGDGEEGGSRWARYLEAEDKCKKATEKVDKMKKQCDDKSTVHKQQAKKCTNLQLQMDRAACSRTIIIKDACESYAECYMSKKHDYNTTVSVVAEEEMNRVQEWHALSRITCLITAFDDGKVTSEEVAACKSATYNTSQLKILYPVQPVMLDCKVPDLYPATAAYKKKEFAPLPVLAKGDPEANECYGVIEISTRPKAGSPTNCTCERVTLNGPYRAGAMVKCTGCLDVYRSTDKDSCPDGTKIFSPRTRSDWKTFLFSAQPLRDPNWIIDITRPQNGCGGCTKAQMNSDQVAQKSWVTSDGSPWWLRSSTYSEPNGDYSANCYMDLWRTPNQEDSITFNDQKCTYHSTSYYCQAKQLSTEPKPGSPAGCTCSTVALTGRYSPGALIKCVGCLDVKKSNQKNSCPEGTKLFSPRSREDWKTLIDSVTPLRSPNWIIDITRPQNGCAGCAKHAMNFETPEQVSWVTEDRSPWWLRSSTYSEPNGDYEANCYMDIWHNPPSADQLEFNDRKCSYHSSSYYCQPTLAKRAR
jgi:hypothetical protein